MHWVLIDRRRIFVFELVFGLEPIVKSVSAANSAMLQMNSASSELNFVECGMMSSGMDFEFFLSPYRWFIKSMRIINLTRCERMRLLPD